MKIENRMKMAGIIACVSAILFALPHFWFGLGIPLAFPGDFQTLSDNNVLWGVGGLAILAAIYAIAFTHSSLGRRLPELIIALPAWIGSVGFTLWGLSYFNLQFLFAINRVQSTPQFAAQDAGPNAIWGYYWYSVFIIWGLSLGIAAFYFHAIARKNNGVEENG
jgi:hypothetical protein